MAAKNIVLLYFFSCSRLATSIIILSKSQTGYSSILLTSLCGCNHKKLLGGTGKTPRETQAVHIQTAHIHTVGGYQVERINHRLLTPTLPFPLSGAKAGRKQLND
jgi:hypothetical protein